MLQQSILTTLRKFPSITLTHFARIVGDKAKGQTQKEGSKKKKQTEFSEKRKTYVCVSGGKKCSFFGKLLVFPPFSDSLFHLITHAMFHFRGYGNGKLT